jgi:hypothetical protein
MEITSFPAENRAEAVSSLGQQKAAKNLRVKAKRRSVFLAYARLP